MGELADFCRSPIGCLAMMAVLAIGMSALQYKPLRAHRWALWAVFLATNSFVISWAILTRYKGD